MKNLEHVHSEKGQKNSKESQKKQVKVQETYLEHVHSEKGQKVVAV